MNVICKNCDQKYNLQEIQVCPNCNEMGGFAQSPSLKTVGKIILHLEEILEHKESKNRFRIKEIQDRGIMVKVTMSIVAKVGTVCYVSNSALGEYERKE